MYCPAESYSTLQNWIHEHSSNKIYARNARHWRVRYNAEAILSYITTVVHFFPRPITNLKIHRDFCPRHWLYNINICDFFLFNVIFNFINHSEMFLKSLRDNFIQNRLQQRSGLSSSKNVISIILKKEKETKFSENLR